jgi:hypothetical protein
VCLTVCSGGHADVRTMDDMLPVSHTCFFSLDVPMYTTYEVRGRAS